MSQLGLGREGAAPPPQGNSGPPHRSHRHQHEPEAREGWRHFSHRDSSAAAPGGGQQLLSPWLPRSHSHGSLALQDSSQGGGFMLATSIPGHRPRKTSTATLPPTTTSSSSYFPSSSSSATQPSELAGTQLWGEPLHEGGARGGEGGGGGVGGKEPARALWREGWRAEGMVCTVPRLHQLFPAPPSQEELSVVASSLDHPRDRHGHSLLLHSLDLLNHMQGIPQTTEMDGGGRAPPHNLPPLPHRYWDPRVRPTVQSHDHHVTPPALCPAVNLDPASEAQLLRKSTAAICFLSGYHSTSLRALDTLASIMSEFLSRLCQQMRIHSNQQQEGRDTGFQGVLERSLWECGVRGKAALHQYWVTVVQPGALQLHEHTLTLHQQTTLSSHSLPPSLLRRRGGETLGLKLLVSDAEEEVGEEEEVVTLDEELTAGSETSAPATVPFPGTPTSSQFPYPSSLFPEGFVLPPDSPTRKRLRTNSFGD